MTPIRTSSTAAFEAATSRGTMDARAKASTPSSSKLRSAIILTRARFATTTPELRRCSASFAICSRSASLPLISGTLPPSAGSLEAGVEQLVDERHGLLAVEQRKRKTAFRIGDLLSGSKKRVGDLRRRQPRFHLVEVRDARGDERRGLRGP